MTRIGTLLVGSALLAFHSSTGLAQAYPVKPIKVIVAQAPGGQTDVIARTVTQRLGEILKQPVVIENRGGVGGTIGADAVAKAPADGYTLLVGGTSNLAIAVALFGTLPYDPTKDFVPVGAIAQVPYALAVNSKVPAGTLAELVAYARNHPGVLTYGSSGNGSNSALAAELFKSMAHLDIVQIPYKGMAPAVTDLVSGHIDIMFADLSIVLPHARAGTVRLLAAAGARRATSAPELPTVAELGFAGFAVEPWYGLVAPAGTPPPVVAKLEEALALALRSDEIRDRLLQHGYEPLGEGSTQFGAAIRSDITRYSALIKDAGIKVEQ